MKSLAKPLQHFILARAAGTVVLSGDTEKLSKIKVPFTRYRFHFISDWVRQSDMKISPVYTIRFSFHIGLVPCHFQSDFV